MEAASARMAARERYGGWETPATTPLQRFIQNACDPQNFEPNLALDLEIADLINQKKGPTPREAAICIVQYVNNRNPNVSLLALTLLDICVKNCGYPFHLQVSTKEFLNELVRRFPERPPLRYSRVQSKILELIEEWRSTICQTSKYKDDLGFIRDMHRLLSYKGYTFPAVKKEDAAVLNPSERLQTAEEMEEEERAAQSAKLQELIRRGTPQDLQEANRLMKIMAGFDTRSKTDYRAKAAEEIAKVQQKARLLEEMLQNHKPGDDNAQADGFEDLANAMASAHPRIQKMCEEESDDHEAVAKLLEINDSIHRTLQRYRLIKAGDIEGAQRIPKGTLGTSGLGVSKGSGGELDLIDLGSGDAPPDVGSSTAAPAATSGSSLENDLLGLSLENGGGAGGQISLGGGNLSTLMANYPGAKPPQPQSSPAPPINTSSKPNLDPFGLGSLGAPSQPQAASSGVTTQHKATPSDPFAALSSSSANSRQASPFPYQTAVQPPPKAPAAQNGLVDDEWTFSSSLPDEPHEITVLDSGVQIRFLSSRQPSNPSEILIRASISNGTPQPVTDFTFQLAVVRSLQLRLEPQSGRNLLPLQRNGITQVIHLTGVEQGRANAVRIRWKASFTLAGTRRDEQGEINNLGIS